MKHKKLLIIIVWLFLAENVISQTTIDSINRQAIIEEANGYRALGDYSAAISSLEKILEIYPDDAPTLLYKGDLLLQNKAYAQAVTVYESILPLNYELTTTRINLSYALFMSRKPKKALKMAYSAWKNDSTHINASINFFNALLWNQKTKEAESFLDLHESILQRDQSLVLKARLATSSGDYHSGLKLYDSLATTYDNKHYIMEYSDVLIGKKEFEKAKAVMQNNGDLFNEKEKVAFQNKAAQSEKQMLGTSFVYFKDIGKNIRTENAIWWKQSSDHKYRFGAKIGTGSVTSAEGKKTTVKFAHLNIEERWNLAWSGQTEIHIQQVNSSDNNKYNGITGRQTIKFQPNDRKMVGFFYDSEILNFTAELLDKDIRSHNIGYVTHFMLSGKTGIYSQGSYGLLNDENQKMQFFASIYHLLRTAPTLKVGLNGSSLHFKENKNPYYFAPDQYLSGEIFADFSTSLPQVSKTYLSAQGAVGSQNIEGEGWDAAYRFQVEVGYRFQTIETSLNYQTSNVASSTGTGYQFNWFTFKAAYRW
ncbi:lipopolysaccharide assembly protein LapB [Echinicola sp. 20G]|uniref:tetratricopeptide repeat protein n=1 Tax=Echinicola sp. 20G TaxID=2781961 RepID=UPI00190FECC3|nr:tetratricopeptide repeat protein [Echinicola sp. 20G]